MASVRVRAMVRVMVRTRTRVRVRARVRARARVRIKLFSLCQPFYSRKVDDRILEFHTAVTIILYFLKAFVLPLFNINLGLVWKNNQRYY